MTDKTTLNRRRLIQGGATFAAAGLTGFPFINRMALRAQEAPLKFWQFYAPGGDVKPQVQWFEKLVADWNDGHDQKVELEYVVNSEYISGSKLATAFASGEGPDIFLISPGDFLRYYNGGVLADLTPHIEDAAKADFPESVIANRMRSSGNSCWSRRSASSAGWRRSSASAEFRCSAIQIWRCSRWCWSASGS
ncbi:extracellular solute-binding protein [Mesorhizobium sp. M0563]